LFPFNLLSQLSQHETSLGQDNVLQYMIKNQKITWKYV
jgi:hypothetical protein